MALVVFFAGGETGIEWVIVVTCEADGDDIFDVFVDLVDFAVGVVVGFEFDEEAGRWRASRLEASLS